MALSEFALIERFFTWTQPQRQDVILGVGDDCALLQPPSGHQLAMTLDTLVEGRHFLPNAAAEDVGFKALAVNLSDLAAMGAEPAWALLGITLRPGDEAWVAALVEGMRELAVQHGVALVGGDTVAGAIRSISVQLSGFVLPGMALRRDGAQPGDWVCVSGTLGDAALAFRALTTAGMKVAPRVMRALLRPQPRFDVARLIRGRASAAIDLSDGLVADLGHILERSGVGARLNLGDVPLSDDVAAYVAGTGDWDLPLAWGDDYQLCFTLSPEHGALLEPDLFRRIGWIEATPGLRLRLPDGQDYRPRAAGFDHFSGMIP